jgi:hypothetical protein
MNFTIRRAAWVPAAVFSIFYCCHIASAADAPDAQTVQVRYAKGAVELTTVQAENKYYKSGDLAFKTFPPELDGLSFVRAPFNERLAVTISAPAGTTVYLMIGPKAQAAKAREAAEAAGWKNSGWVQLAGKNSSALILYKQTMTKQLDVNLPEGGYYGIGIAAKQIALGSDHPGGKEPAAPSRSKTMHADSGSESSPVAGPTARATNPQATIKALEIYETESGMMLGQTSEATLTIVRGEASRLVDVHFVTPVGEEMRLTRDEALRFIHLTYPNWYVAKAEITFEDKYVAHDGGSIGAGIGTMILSVIQGFAIDPNVAITGDISANGKVRAIGGVSAKIRGATESNCTIVAIPADNYGQLVDMVTYSGPATVVNLQIIGITDLDSAVAVVRVDRDAKLAKAISMFGGIQSIMKAMPGYLAQPEAKAKLTEILQLAPQHLSAKLLLGIASGEQPKTLSATASQYYTSLAVRGMLPILAEREFTKDSPPIQSATLSAGLADLRKLRPLAHPQVQPLIDAWSRFIQVWNSQQQGNAAKTVLDRQRQILIDEMTRLQTNAELMQKMLKEGV